MGGEESTVGPFTISGKMADTCTSCEESPSSLRRKEETHSEVILVGDGIVIVLLSRACPTLDCERVSRTEFMVEIFTFDDVPPMGMASLSVGS